MKILHLSDIHVCKENKAQYQVLCDGIIAALKNHPDGAIKPDAVLITGDYTHSGTVEEYTMFKRPFKKMLNDGIFSDVKHLILVPGNHDYPWDNDEPRDVNFCEIAKELGKCDIIDDESMAEQMAQENVSHFYEECDGYRVLLIGMNSMKIDSQERKGIGYFDTKQFALISEMIKHYKGKSSKVLYTFVAFHHHLLPVSFVERDIRQSISEGKLTAQQIHNILLEEIAAELNKPQEEVDIAYVNACQDFLTELNRNRAAATPSHYEENHIAVQRKTQPRFSFSPRTALGKFAVVMCIAILIVTSSLILPEGWIITRQSEDEGQYIMQGIETPDGFRSVAEAGPATGRSGMYVTSEWSEVVQYMDGIPPVPQWLPSGWNISKFSIGLADNVSTLTISYVHPDVTSI